MSEANKPAFVIAFVLVAQLIFIGIMIYKLELDDFWI
jgi:hypothetical protein